MGSDLARLDTLAAAIADRARLALIEEVALEPIDDTLAGVAAACRTSSRRCATLPSAILVTGTIDAERFTARVAQHRSTRRRCSTNLGIAELLAAV